MAWNFDNVLTASVPSATDMVFAGQYVWVSSSTQIVVYDYWGANANYEGLYGGYHPNFYTPAPTLYLVTTLLYGAQYLLTDGTYVYVISGTSVLKINATTFALVDSFVLPVVPNGKPTIGNGRLWYTDAAPSTSTAPDRQKLYYTDTTTEVSSAGTQIPIRKQFNVHTLTYDNTNNWVVVANFNNSSVMKFDGTTAAYISTIIVNRKPRAMSFSSMGDLLVASKNGMLTTVDLTTEIVSNDLATYQEARSFADDGTYVWSVIEEDPGDEQTNTPAIVPGALARTTWGGSPYYDNFRAMTGGDESYAIKMDKFTTTNFLQLILTPSFTYGGPVVTVAPYVFLRNSSRVYAFRNKSLYRENYVQVRASAMIATGPEAYFGETT